MLTALKARLEAAWHDLTSEARADIAAALKDAEEKSAKLGPIVAGAEADIKALVASAEPAVKTAVESRLGKLVAEVGALLEDAAKGL